MNDPVRSLVLWLPDWPVTAFLRENPDLHAEAPLAVIRSNLVVACSSAARAEGVRRGQRLRDAQARCTTLRAVPDDPARDQRAFLPVLDRIEQLAPGVHPLRPGLCALRARGPARYYGGEESAALTLCAAVIELGLPDVRAGVADGLFTAEQAARRASSPASAVVVAPGASRDFLAPVPIAAIDDDDLVDLLARLGVQTLGDFADLDETRVGGRLGDRGMHLHRLARGADSRPVTARVPPVELAREIAFEPPLELADQVAFGVRRLSDEVIEALGAEGLVCTELRVELTDERGAHSERLWLHPTFFSAAEIVDRVRWQLEASLRDGSGRESRPRASAPAPAAPPESRLGSPIALVRISPETVDDAAHHGPGLFGQGPGERVHHALSRIQAMLGHRGVVLPVVDGGRWLTERQLFVPWGDRVVPQRDPRRPWPGSLPSPLPVTVFDALPEAEVMTPEGSPVHIDERGGMTGPPAWIRVEGTRERRISAWAGPWPVREREWDDDRSCQAHRLQVVDEQQRAWLVVREDDRWRVEGCYE